MARALRQVGILAVGIALGLALFVGGCGAVVAYQDHRDKTAGAKATRLHDQALEAQRAADDARERLWQEEQRRAAAAAAPAIRARERADAREEAAAVKHDAEQAAKNAIAP